jgi:hypothetical protein
MCCTKLLTYACDHSGLSHIKVTSLRFILASSLDFSPWKPSPLLFCAISGPGSRSINLHISLLCYDVLVPISFVFHCLLYVVSPNPVASGTKRNDTAYYLETYANLSTGRRMLHCKEFISHVESFDEMAARRDLSFSRLRSCSVSNGTHTLCNISIEPQRPSTARARYLAATAKLSCISQARYVMFRRRYGIPTGI